MIQALKNAYEERKIANIIHNFEFNFTANIEAPEPFALQAEILSISPKPLLILLNDKIALKMAQDKSTSGFISQDRESIKRNLLVGGAIMAPAGLIDKKVLEIINLHIVILQGRLSFADLSEEVKDDLFRLGDDYRVTTFGDDGKDFILPPDTAKQLWDIEKLMMVCAGFHGYDHEDFDKMAAAKLMGEAVPYLKASAVKTKRANIRMQSKGLRISFL